MTTAAYLRVSAEPRTPPPSGPPSSAQPPPGATPSPTDTARSAAARRSPGPNWSASGPMPGVAMSAGCTSSSWTGSPARASGTPSRSSRSYAVPGASWCPSAMGSAWMGLRRKSSSRSWPGPQRWSAWASTRGLLPPGSGWSPQSPERGCLGSRLPAPLLTTVAQRAVKQQDDPTISGQPRSESQGATYSRPLQVGINLPLER